MNAVNTQGRPPALDERAVRVELDRLTPDLVAMLPSNVTVERFKRVALTAVQQVPKLLQCHPPSLFNACLKAAADGLLPDGRDGAITPRWNGKDKRLDATWQPMIAGIQKKVKNSGNVATLSAQIVYEGEVFSFELGDDEKIVHRRDINRVKRGKEVAVYAIATMKDGSKEREVMSWQQVQDVRAVSDGADKGPWLAWEDEMARKTVVRRLAKRLPSLDDGDDGLRTAIERVDELYPFGRKPAEIEKTTHRPAALSAPESPATYEEDPVSDGPNEDTVVVEATKAAPLSPAAIALAEKLQQQPINHVALIKDRLSKCGSADDVRTVDEKWRSAIQKAEADGKPVPTLLQETVRGMLAERMGDFMSVPTEPQVDEASLQPLQPLPPTPGPSLEDEFGEGALG